MTQRANARNMEALSQWREGWRMTSCERMAGCPLFKQFSINASLRVWTARYCEKGFSSCERFKLAREGRQVPLNLLPNGRMLKVALEAASLTDTTDP